MNAETAMDEVTDLIANIEMHRQEIEKEAGIEASRTYALRRLNLAMQGEQEEIRLHGTSAARVANTEALAVAIKKVEGLRSGAGRQAAPGKPPQGKRQKFWRGPQRASSKPHGKKPMGRHTGR